MERIRYLEKSGGSIIRVILMNDVSGMVQVVVEIVVVGINEIMI